MRSVKQTALGVMCMMAQTLCAQDVGQTNISNNAQLEQQETLPQLGLDLQSPVCEAVIKRADAHFPIYMVRYTQENMYGTMDVRLLIADKNGDHVLTQDDDILGAQYKMRKPFEKIEKLGCTFSAEKPVRITRYLDNNGEITDREKDEDETILPVINECKDMLMLAGTEYKPLVEFGRP
jgi:hypothetical protein